MRLRYRSSHAATNLIDIGILLFVRASGKNSNTASSIWKYWTRFQAESVNNEASDVWDSFEFL